MSKRVKMYGGPLYGETINVQDGCMRIDAMDNRFQSRRADFMFRPEAMPKLTFERRTYEVNMWHERRGQMGREMRVGIIEGKKNLLDREEFEIERDIRSVPWRPLAQPIILKDFESWFAVTAYKYTGDEVDIHDLLYH